MTLQRHLNEAFDDFSRDILKACEYEPDAASLPVTVIILCELTGPSRARNMIWCNKPAERTVKHGLWWRLNRRHLWRIGHLQPYFFLCCQAKERLLGVCKILDEFGRWKMPKKLFVLGTCLTCSVTVYLVGHWLVNKNYVVFLVPRSRLRPEEPVVHTIYGAGDYSYVRQTELFTYMACFLTAPYPFVFLRRQYCLLYRRGSDNGRLYKRTQTRTTWSLSSGR